MLLNTSLVDTSSVPAWLAAPFVILLLLIAVGPLFFKDFWNRHYKLVSVAAGVIVAAIYILHTRSVVNTEETLFDFFSFISMLGALYVVSGGIYIDADFKGTPVVNAAVLLVGAFLCNILGTTGAAILLLKPFIRLNRHRMKPYLIVFYIFLICNIGGILSPLGPPLILGYIKGVPFEWTLKNLIVEWITAVVIVLALFLVFDMRNKTNELTMHTYSGKISIVGRRNFFWLMLIILTVFMDPERLTFLPTIRGHSFVREISQILIAVVCFTVGNRRALQLNRFHFGPIREVGFLFFGIFLTMMPALDLLSDFVTGLGSREGLSPSVFYWGAGITSSILDNAPAYLLFLTTAMSVYGMPVNDPAAVAEFSTAPETIIFVRAIALGASFFGAMTYIGNGPNFMVKAVCEDMKINIPSFFGFMLKYSIPVLLPVLILVWFLFIWLRITTP